MWCCRAFFFPVHFFLLCIHPSSCFPSPSCCSSYCFETSFPLTLCFFQKKKRKERKRSKTSVALQTKVNILCAVEAALCFHASGDFTVLSSSCRITGSPYSHPSMSALLIVGGTNHGYLDPEGTQHSVT